MIAPSQGDELVKRKPNLFDKRALQDPQNVEPARQEIVRLPDLHWVLRADSHLYAVVGWVRGILSRLFPLPRREPREQWLSESTWSLVNTKKYLRAQELALGRKLRDAGARA